MAAQLTSKASEFFEAVNKLAALDIENREFHCDTCRTTFCSIQEKARVFLSSKDKDDSKITFSLAQLDFARDIIMGRVCSGRSRRVAFDPNEVRSVSCVHIEWAEERRHEHDDEGNQLKSFIKGKDGKVKLFKVPVHCSNTVTGTRAQIGEFKTLCEEHRS